MALAMELVAALVACASPVAEVEAEVSRPPHEPTVLLVAFTTEDGVEARVEFGETEALGWTTPASTGTDHLHTLLGMPPDTDVHYRLVLDGTPQSIRNAHTGLLPPTIPDLTTVEDDATWEGFLVTTLLGQWQGPVILDGHGRIVWFYEDPDGPSSIVVRAAPTLDGTGVVYNRVASGEDEELGRIERVPWDAASKRTMSAPGQSHDFVEVAPETFVSIAIARREVDGVNVRGDQLVELSSAGSRVIFDTWDWLDPADTGPVDADGSWTHANALHWYPDEGVYRMGLRNLDTIATIDAASGVPVDFFGGALGAGWTIADDERGFRYQHNFQQLEDRLLLFDNGLADDDDSRVVEYQVDPVAQTATRVWSRHLDPARWLYALGDVERLPDDSTLIAWSVAGRLEQVRDDATIWRVEAPVGTAFGYLRRVDSLYPVSP